MFNDLMMLIAKFFFWCLVGYLGVWVIGYFILTIGGALPFRKFCEFLNKRDREYEESKKNR